jgi:hypothetical protein
MALLPKTQEQYSSHIPALHVLAALGYEYLTLDECLSKRKSASFAREALKNYCMSRVVAQIVMMARKTVKSIAIAMVELFDAASARLGHNPYGTRHNKRATNLLRWLSSPKPRLVLPPTGGKLRPHLIYRAEYRQAATNTGMGGCP